MVWNDSFWSRNQKSAPATAIANGLNERSVLSSIHHGLFTKWYNCWPQDSGEKNIIHSEKQRLKEKRLFQL